MQSSPPLPWVGLILFLRQLFLMAWIVNCQLGEGMVAWDSLTHYLWHMLQSRLDLRGPGLNDLWASKTYHNEGGWSGCGGMQMLPLLLYKL